MLSATAWLFRGRTGLKSLLCFVIIADIITFCFYQHRDNYKLVSEELETTKKIPDMSSEELSKFPNQTYWGSVRSQEIKLMNIGIEHNPKLVIYNRVPKCGSTTTLDIIRFLKKKLHFNVYNDIAPHMTHYVDDDKQEMELIHNITKIKRPLLYIRHVYFIRFNAFGYRNPIYINIARDPVDLFISNYYYLRFGFQNVKNGTNAQNWKRDMPDERRNMTIDECTTSENHECARPYSNLIPFFCGSSKVCQKRGDDALKIAKENVREKYAIVGIMEDFPQTMKAFETLAPRFFMGAEVLYNRASQALHENSKTASRKEPNPETVAYLKKGLSREYELYNFIKEVFYEKINFLKSNGLWEP
jgi:dermatan/chondrotin sulfate uronyl 2-O-sulfotransferase UST